METNVISMDDTKSFIAGDDIISGQIVFIKRRFPFYQNVYIQLIENIFMV
jgi:hypothetical protein